MINKTNSITRALLSLPYAQYCTLQEPHLILDYNGKRILNNAALEYNINTFTTTELDPANKNVPVQKRSYVTFRLPGFRKPSKNAGKKRPFKNRPRGKIEVVVKAPRKYRRHCGQPSI